MGSTVTFTGILLIMYLVMARHWAMDEDTCDYICALSFVAELLILAGVMIP
jgi:hypothetical protein